MTSLLVKNPDKRLGVGGVEDVKAHPWFAVSELLTVSQRLKFNCLYLGFGLEESVGQATTPTVQALHVR